MKGKFLQFILGVLTGAALFGGVSAVAAGIAAEPAWSPIFVDGQQVQMTAYNILGNNYVKLRDIGKAVGFNVYYQGGVQVDSKAPYTGEAPAKPAEAVPESTDELTEVRQEMIRLINQVRRENGVGELTVSTALMDAAQDCARQGFRSHDIQYENESGLRHGYPHGFGSNLTVFTYNVHTDIARTAVSHWRYSPGHFQTMIAERYDSIGVGVMLRDDVAYCYMFAGNSNSINPYA